MVFPTSFEGTVTQYKWPLRRRYILASFGAEYGQNSVSTTLVTCSCNHCFFPLVLEVFTSSGTRDPKSVLQSAPHLSQANSITRALKRCKIINKQ